MTKPKLGGPRPGSSRKPISPTGEAMRQHTIRMTEAEWQKLLQLGGAPWIREQVKKASLDDK